MYISGTVQYLQHMRGIHEIMNSTVPIRSIHDLKLHAQFFDEWFIADPARSISKGTIFALRASTLGFLKILELTFSEQMQYFHPGVYIVPKQISQDVVESYFSRVRSMAGDGGHMTQQTYGYLCETIMAMKSN